MNPSVAAPLWHTLGLTDPGAYASFEILAVVVSALIAVVAARRLGLQMPRFGMALAFTYLASATTSKLTWALTVTRPGFIRDGADRAGWLAFAAEHLWPPWGGGQVFYGSLAGVLLGALLYMALQPRPWQRRDLLGYLDMSAFTLLAISAIGRLGCHFAGCCYGRPSARWGLIFPPHSAAASELRARGLLAALPHETWGPPTLPLFPTQLLEACTSAAILALLLWRLMSGPRQSPGAYFWLGLLLHAIVRFNLEWLRDDLRGGLGPLSTSQIIALVLVSVLLLARWRARPS